MLNAEGRGQLFSEHLATVQEGEEGTSCSSHGFSRIGMDGGVGLCKKGNEIEVGVWAKR